MANEGKYFRSYEILQLMNISSCGRFLYYTCENKKVANQFYKKLTTDFSKIDIGSNFQIKMMDILIEIPDQWLGKAKQYQLHIIKQLPKKAEALTTIFAAKPSQEYLICKEQGHQRKTAYQNLSYYLSQRDKTIQVTQSQQKFNAVKILLPNDGRFCNIEEFRDYLITLPKQDSQVKAMPPTPDNIELLSTTDDLNDDRPKEKNFSETRSGDTEKLNAFRLDQPLNNDPAHNTEMESDSKRLKIDEANSVFYSNDFMSPNSNPFFFSYNDYKLIDIEHDSDIEIFFKNNFN